MGGAQSTISNGVWTHEATRTSKNSFSPNPNPHNDNRRCSHHRHVRCYSRQLVSRTQSHPATVNSTRPLHPHQPIRSRISLDVISEDFRVNARRRKQLIPRAKLITKKQLAEERLYSGTDGSETPLENFPLLRRVKTRNNLAEFIAEQQLLIGGGAAKPLTQSPNIVELYDNGDEVPRYVEPENPYSVLLNNYNTYAKNRGLDNVSLKGSIRERFRKSSATSLGSKNKFKMSRRPQILHIVDSANSRQKNQTYTKNTSKGLASGIKKSYEVSDWETYGVLPLNGRQETEEGQDEMSEICLNDLSQSKESTNSDMALEEMMQNVENTYATIQKRHLDDIAMASGSTNIPAGETTDHLNFPRENNLNQSEERTIRVEIHDTMQTDSGEDGLLKLDNKERLEVESPIQNFSEVELEPSRTESPVRNISPVGAKECAQTQKTNGDVGDVLRTHSESPLKNFSEVKLENVELGSPVQNVTQAKTEYPKSGTEICQATKAAIVEVEKPKIIAQEQEPKKEVVTKSLGYVGSLSKRPEETEDTKEKPKDVQHTAVITGVKLQSEPKRMIAQNGHELLKDKVSIRNLKCVFEDTKVVSNGNVKKMITRSESLASVVPPSKPSSEMEKLREMHKIENKGIDSQMSKMNSEANESQINSLSKERSRSLLNLNSAQTEKVRFKKLGRKIEGRENKFNKKNIYNEVSCTKGHFKLLTKNPSINRSMPEYLNESFVIENPNNRIRAIENHLNHIHQTNMGKVQNTSKPGLKKCMSYPNDQQVHKKVSKAPNCNNVNAKDEGKEKKPEKTNNLNENGHEKLVQTKSNEERSTNCENLRKVAAFDGLLQYLQDYRLGLRELLVNNNVVIIEPVRESAVRLEEKGGFVREARSGSAEGACRITGAMVKTVKPLTGKKELSYTLSRQQFNQPKIKRHFFYHPCNKVNPYLVDKELPDPDLVKVGRQKYEEFLKLKVKKEEILSGNATPIKTRSKYTEDDEKPLDTKNEDTDMKSGDDPANKRKLHRFLTVDTVFRDKILKRWTDSGSLSSGISSDLSCCDTDLESPTYDMKHDYSSDDEYFDSFNSKNFEVEYHYVAPEVLEKIRACGESTTYYGGRIVSSTKGTSPMNCIMNEIQEDSRGRNTNKNYLGVKFRLVKSNSCGSRLELAGADDTPSAKPVERSQTFSKTSNTKVDKDTARCETFYKIFNKNDEDEEYTQETPKPFSKLKKTEDVGYQKPVTFFSHVPNDMDFGSKKNEISKPQIELKMVETRQNVIQFGQTSDGKDLPKIKVQKVIEEIEALNYDVKRFDNKTGTHPGALGKESKAQVVATTPESQEEKNWKQEFTYKAMARKYEMIENEVVEEPTTIAKEKPQPQPPQERVTNKAVEIDKTGEIKAKKEIVEFKEVYENIKRGTEKNGTEPQKSSGTIKVPENRGKVVPKVLLSIEKSKGCKTNGYGVRRVCDMEFETFEVLDTTRGTKTAEKHICAGEEGAATDTCCPAEDIDRDSLSSIDNDHNVPMTSWANHQKTPVTFDFRNSDQCETAHSARTNQSSC